MSAMLSPHYAITVEPMFPHLWAEMQPLTEAHWREIANYQDVIALRPDREFYLRQCAEGGVLAITCRCDGALVGYSIFFLRTLAHYGQVKQAVNDVIFLDPEHRGPMGLKLIDDSERLCAAIGMDKIVWHVKPTKDWSAILKRRGYICEDMILGKVL